MIVSMSRQLVQIPSPGPQLHSALRAEMGRAARSPSRSRRFSISATRHATDALQAHLADVSQQGVSPPRTVPSLYSLPEDRVTTRSAITAVGDQTYAEVEYALVLSPSGRWLFAVASDHTDALVEEADVARGKGITHDVPAPTAWWLDDVRDDTEQFILSATSVGDSDVTTQTGRLVSLLFPATLLATLERRLGTAPEPGTVVLSGTVDGHPQRGSRRWRILVDDPAGARRIEHTYDVHALEAEHHGPGADA